MARFVQSTVNMTTSVPAWRGDEVRVVTFAEYKQAALCLAEAFAEDEVAQYFTHCPDNEHLTAAQRWDLHVSILEYIVYAHLLKGLVLTVGPDYGCVALWMPPGNNMDDMMTIFRSGMWRLNYKLSPEGRARYFNEFFPLLHDTKLQVLGPRDDDSYYLVYIGTKPAARKMGLAKKLIQAVVAKADSESRACYLESSHAANVAYYRTLGFEVETSVQLTRAKEVIELDIMIREPKKDCSTTPVTVATTEKQAHAVSLIVKVEKGTTARVALL